MKERFITATFLLAATLSVAGVSNAAEIELRVRADQPGDTISRYLYSMARSPNTSDAAFMVASGLGKIRLFPIREVSAMTCSRRYKN